MSLHPARECPCGAGLELPLGLASGTARLIAARAPLASVEIEAEQDLDRAEVPGAAVPDVTCHACGAVAPATHVLTCADGRPVGAAPLEDMAADGPYAALEAERAANQRAALPPIPRQAPDCLPEGW